MIRVNVINGLIVLGSDNNDLLTMKQMTLPAHRALMKEGLEVFREKTALEVKNRFDEVNPSFNTEDDRKDALDLLTAKFREEPGATGIQKDYDIKSHEAR